MADDKQLNELSAKVNAISEEQTKMGETIANAVKEAVEAAVKPITDNLAEMQANAKAKDEAELAGLVEKIVKANLLTEDAAKGLNLNAARELAKKAEPGKAAGLNSAFGGGGADDFADYDMNAHLKEAS